MMLSSMQTFDEFVERFELLLIKFLVFHLTKRGKLGSRVCVTFHFEVAMNPNAFINSTRLPVFRFRIKTEKSCDIKNLFREIEIQLLGREDTRTIVFHSF